MKIKSLLLSTVAAASLFAIGSTAANADTVTVKSGDTVAKIAAAHNTTVSAIETANNLSNVNLIYVGNQLEVNGMSTTSSTSTSNVSTTATTANNANTSATTQSTSQPSTASTTQTANTASTSTTSTTSGSDSSAKAWIAGKESGGSYSAANGNYYGKYQLSKSYLNGDYSAANQEKVANNYVSSRYGSWSAAKAHWLSNGWY
ncbi:LysM peptidoglycan-binding domain-containing protein [Lactiplantibacillus dongliensis]|uniref:LysM peptidoglycan-binding domain-containing protein n=1 Tax=Lactiplantibacillus dongliensis TaxID=2559919 RepID=A0ABW1R5H1_9LACO|nr:LysM peptidoglycan-binding domain-containing protein [Lactiplantibacillus dongliensis]